MNQQQLRKLILLISFIAFPITLFYFSPALILQGAVEGVITGSFVVFVLQFLSGLFFGRAFCGWLCPGGGLQEACMMAVNRKAKGGRLNWIKYFLWVLWAGGIMFLFITGNNPLRIDFLYETASGISIHEPVQYIIYYGVVGLIFLLAVLFGKRAFCHYLCWMAPFMVIGSWLRRKLNLPSLQLKADSSRCIRCNKCSQVCAMSLNVSEMVQEKKMVDSECILCGECIDACPKKVLYYNIGRMQKGSGETWPKHQKPGM